MMRTYMTTALLMILSVITCMAEDAVVYLKNGSIIKGEVIEYVADGNIKIAMEDGSVCVFKSNEVSRIKNVNMDSYVQGEDSVISVKRQKKKELPKEKKKSGYAAYEQGEDSIISVRRQEKSELPKKKKKNRYAAMVNFYGGNCIFLNKDRVKYTGIGSFGISTTHGGRINDNIMIGGGIGCLAYFYKRIENYDYHVWESNDKRVYITEYAEIRARAGKKLCRFTGGFRIGTTFLTKDFSCYFYAHIDMGVQIRTKNIDINITPYFEIVEDGFWGGGKAGVGIAGVGLGLEL